MKDSVDAKRYFSSLSPNLNKVNSETSSHQVKMERCNPSIILLLRPASFVCRIFGVLPITITSNHNPSKTSASLVMTKNWILYSIFVLLISSSYMGFQAVSLILSISNSYRFIDLVAQSLWINSGLIAYAVSVFMLCRGQGVIRLFRNWCKIEMDLERLFCPLKTRLHIRAFQIGYFLLASTSTALCVFHARKLPFNPVYPLAYFKDYIEHQSMSMDAIVWGYAFLQGLMLIWKWAGIAVLEGICCLFATLSIQCMTCLINGLESAFCNMKTSDDRPYSAAEVDHPIQMSQVEAELEISEKLKDCPVARRHPDSPKNKDDYLILVIQKLQTLASLQMELNNVLGPLILLDVSQLVILVCALSFLPVKYFSVLDFHSTIIFVGNGIAMLFRLIVLIVCLGNVYSKGQDVNMALARAMSSGKLSTAAQNPALAYLSVYSANPVSFTAWGFFPITRGTLLAAFSLISTYTVIFVQIQM